MILTCPSCGTRYVVKDGAIPAGGRTVRCAQCKHSWHQDSEDLAAAEAGEGAAEPVRPTSEQPGAAASSEPASRHPLGEESGTPAASRLGDHAHPDLSSDEDSDAQPLPGPEIRPQASMMVEPEPADPAEPELAQSRFAEEETMPREAAEASDPYPEEAVPVDEEEPRSSHPLRAARNEAEDPYSPFAPRDMEDEAPRRRWPLLLLLGLLAIAAIAVAIWFLAPLELKSRLGLAQASGETELLLQIKQQSRQQLASGNQMLEVSGLVINPTDETQPVPPLQGQLRNLEQKVVYRWTIPPPAPRLAPGGSASFNSTELDVPADAACIDIDIGSPREPQAPCPPAGASPEAATGA